VVKIGRVPGCKIKTGTYTGDGTESQAITGVGFRPKYVAIWIQPGGPSVQSFFEKVDQFLVDLSFMHFVWAGQEHIFQLNALISLDADGFTVDDAGTDSDPNKNAQVYVYLALG